MITIIHGPMRSGKTLNADAFAKRYGCRRVVDGWPDDGARRTPPRDGDLVLTTAPVDRIRRNFPGANIITINSARRAIGLKPAPKNGFTFKTGARK